MNLFRPPALSPCLALAVAVTSLCKPDAARAAEDPPPYYFSTLAGASNIGNADGTGVAARFYSPVGAVLDHSGNLWVADTYNHTIRRISPTGAVTTVAGLAGFSGADDGAGRAARFFFPAGLAVDSADNLYVADVRNYTIRRVTPAGVVTTLAGSAGNAGFTDGTGSAARFNTPQGMAVDVAGNLYVADSGNATIRKITPGGMVTTWAGAAGDPGSADGSGATARFRYPVGLAADGAGNLYVADTFNHTIRRINPAGAVTTVSGQPGEMGSTDGLAGAARFSNPQGVTLDASGNLYVADGGNCTIRKITPSGVVTTLAGTAGTLGWADGTGGAARFNFPCSVVATASAGLLVADTYNSTIRSITPAGVVTTVAGSADSRGSADGAGGSARFNFPGGVTVDGTGVVFVADTSNNTIRRITPEGVVSTLAGKAGAVVQDPHTGQLTGTYADGTGGEARLLYPRGVALDRAGTVYVADTGNHVIRRITAGGVVTTLAGKAGSFGWADGTGSAALFFDPSGLVVDSSGDVLVADSSNHVIRRITPAGAVTTFAGLPQASGSADGMGSAARFNSPHGLAMDRAGNFYVADQFNHTIRRITPAGEVTTLAGRAGASGSVDDTGSLARFSQPSGLAVDQAGNVYVADNINHTFRRITPAGVVTTLAGKGGTDGSADGIGNSARFFFPTCVALDEAGVAYVTDSFNNTIRKGQLASAPVAVTQPKSQTVAAGATVQFAVVAAAVPAPAYQWYFNGSPFVGATASTLSFTNARASDAGDYTVVVSNELGSVTSNKATLSVGATSGSPTSPASSGGSGGGSVGAGFVLTLTTAAMVAALRANRARKVSVT